MTSEPTSRAVNHLLRQFAELQQRPRGGGPGLIENLFQSAIPTVFVAASNAATWIRDAADRMPGGFVCDGTDDQEEINAAATLAGPNGRVVLSAGSFSCRFAGTANVIVANDPVTIQGMGMGVTTIDVTDDFGTLDSGSSYIVKLNDLRSTIRDLTITGSGGTVESGVLLGNSYSQAENVRVNVSGNGITAWGNFCSILNNILETAADGVRCESVESTRILSNQFSSGGHGVLIQGSFAGQTTVFGNVFDVGLNGIRIETGGMFNFLIAANTVSGANAGIVATSTLTQGVIVGNTLSVSGIGIDIAAGSEALDITDNWIQQAGEGIFLRGGTRFTVANNIVDQGNQHGIRIDDVSDSLITGNHCYWPGQGADNTYDGILVEGTSSRNTITGNKITPSDSFNSPRYGINIAASTCVQNVVVNNDLGYARDYGTGPYNDQGDDTHDSFLNHPTFGDNFVIGLTIDLTGFGPNASSGTGDLTVTP